MTDCPDVETEFIYPSQPLALDDYDVWTANALDWIEAQRSPWDADDMRKALPAPPHHNLVGAVVNTARVRDLIRLVAHGRSTAPSRRHSSLRVWETVRSNR